MSKSQWTDDDVVLALKRRVGGYDTIGQLLRHLVARIEELEARMPPQEVRTPAPPPSPAKRNDIA